MERSKGHSFSYWAADYEFNLHDVSVPVDIPDFLSSLQSFVGHSLTQTGQLDARIANAASSSDSSTPLPETLQTDLIISELQSRPNALLSVLLEQCKGVYDKIPEYIEEAKEEGTCVPEDAALRRAFDLTRQAGVSSLFEQNTKLRGSITDSGGVYLTIDKFDANRHLTFQVTQDGAKVYRTKVWPNLDAERTLWEPETEPLSSLLNWLTK